MSEYNPVDPEPHNVQKCSEQLSCSDKNPINAVLLPDSTNLTHKY